MKAVVYHGPKDMRVEEVPNPQIEKPTDAVLKVSSAAICGSDLHMYEGRTAAQPGMVFGHEITGTVDQVGDGVQQIKQGDRVVLPFNIACGACFNCLRGYTNLCYSTAEPGSAGAAYGYVGLGNYRGGQAEYVRVPFADFNAIKLPGTIGDELEDDYVLLADVFPTAYHAAVLANVQLGFSVAIFGAGPVGLLAVMAARLRSAAEIYIVDRHKTRLDKAAELGATPINLDDGDPVVQIRTLRKNNDKIQGCLRPGEEPLGKGVLSGIDAVGYQAHSIKDPTKEESAQVLESLSDLVVPAGALGVIGAYFSADPGVSGPAAEGRYLLPFGKMWEKGLEIGTGQCPVKRYGEGLRNMVAMGKANPGTIVTNRISIDEAPEWYERFDRREEGVIKVVIKF